MFAPSFHQHDDPLRHYAVIQLSENKKAGTVFNYPKDKNRWLTNKNYAKPIYSDNKDYTIKIWKTNEPTEQFLHTQAVTKIMGNKTKKSNPEMPDLLDFKPNGLNWSPP